MVIIAMTMTNTPITSRGLFLIISLFAGAVLLLQAVDFQPVLSTGDHGMILYAAEANLRGERPFHDYHYFYGPLMTYYYSLFFKLFGHAIISVLIAKAFLTLISGLLIYAILSLFLWPSVSCVGALWFWVFNQEFHYTYNHVGVTVVSLAVLYWVLLYYKEKRLKYLYFALCACVVAGLIKLNFGGSLLAYVTLGALFVDISQKQRLDKRFYLCAFLAGPVAIVLSNAAFIAGLPLSVIKQCYQYFGNDVVAQYYPPLYKNIWLWVQITYLTIIRSWYSELILVIVAIAGVANIQLAKRGALTDLGGRNIFMVAVLVGMLYFFNLHEFLISGVVFRNYYAFPMLVVFLFMVIGLWAHHAPRLVRSAVLTVICFVLLLQFMINVRHIDSYRTGTHYLAFDKAKIHVGNSIAWTRTVSQAVLYLDKDLDDGEMFLALPYEPLYYFLTDRPSPNRLLAGFKFLNMTKEQDESLIRSIEDNRIDTVLLSNRVITNEIGLGVFGRDYCPLLYAYLEKNFEIAKEFGIWTHVPSWANYHGIRILKRKK
jgi:hypothetical protein